MPNLRRQRGAIGLMAAMVLLLALMMLMLSADAGRLYYEKRRLQRVVDMAAMESASRSGLCGTVDPGDVTDLAQASATRHGYAGTLGDAANQVRLGYVDLNSAEEHRVFTASETRAEAVFVRATQAVPASLVLGGLFGEEVTLAAEAVAQRPALASFSLGSGLLSLDSNQSSVLNAVLGQMLGTSLSLDAVSYQGLANAKLNLLELNENLPLGTQLDLSAGNVDELLNTQLTVDQVLEAMVGAVNGRNSLSADLVMGLASLANVTMGATQITLAEILKVETPVNGGDEALRTDLNAMDLVTALAFLANDDSAVTVDLGVSLGSLSNAEVKLYVIQPPQIAIGLPGKDANGDWRTRVQTAQVRLQVSSEASLPGLLTVSLGLTLDVASGWAALDTVDCGSILPGEREVEILAKPGLASLGLGTFQDISGAQITLNPVFADVLPVLDGVSVKVSAQTQVASASAETVAFALDEQTVLPVTQRSTLDTGNALAQGLSGLANNLSVDVTGAATSCGLLGLGCLVDAVLGPITESVLQTAVEDLVAQLIGNLGNTLLEPLLSMLGVQLGYVDVRLLDLETAAPQLML